MCLSHVRAHPQRRHQSAVSRGAAACPAAYPPPRAAGPAADRRSPDRTGRPGVPAFTLIELLAVVVVILLLAGLVIGLGTYVRLRAMKNRAHAEIAVLSLACESFKADVGRFPTSSVYRMTKYPNYDYFGGWYELWNSSLLGGQLVDGGYYLASLTIRTNGANSPLDACHTLTNKSVAVVSPTTYTNLLNVLIDPWERPYNYFCTYPPNTVGVATNFQTPCVYQTIGTNAGVVTTTLYPSYAWIGGQVNAASYDLWSYGQNMRSCPAAASCVGYNDDDIGNFQY